MKKPYDFSKARRGPVVPVLPGKTRVAIRLDDEVLEWFRAKADAAGGANYETMINDALRGLVEGSAESAELGDGASSAKGTASSGGAAAGGPKNPVVEPVVDAASHRRALARIEVLWDAEAGSPGERELDALATAVDAYERREFPVSMPEDIELARAGLEAWADALDGEDGGFPRAEPTGGRRMRAVGVHVPASLYERLALIAEREGVEIQQLVASAVGEKVAAMDAELLLARAAEGDREKFLATLAKVPDQAAAKGGGGPVSDAPDPALRRAARALLRRSKW